MCVAVEVVGGVLVTTSRGGSAGVIVCVGKGVLVAGELVLVGLLVRTMRVSVAAMAVCVAGKLLACGRVAVGWGWVAVG